MMSEEQRSSQSDGLRVWQAFTSALVNSAQWRTQNHFIFMVFLAWCKSHHGTSAAVHAGPRSAGKLMKRKDAGCENRWAKTNLGQDSQCAEACAAGRFLKRKKESEFEITAVITSTELSIFSCS